MANGAKNPKVDLFFTKVKHWQAELEALRAILLASELVEELKWGKPCYTYEGGNVAILFEFKDCAAIGFLKGTLLPDPAGVLLSPGENSQAMRMIKFTDPERIQSQADLLREYLANAIAVEKAGLTVSFAKSADPDIPAEFQQRLEELPALKTAFESLTPGRQRAYLLYFSAAKQSQTRAARIEKWIPAILEGKGIAD